MLNAHCTCFCTNQLRVQGFDFVASGEAGSKTEAQRIAAKAFCEYLIAQKQLQPHELVSSVFCGARELFYHFRRLQPGSQTLLHNLGPCLIHNLDHPVCLVVSVNCYA